MTERRDRRLYANAATTPRKLTLRAVNEERPRRQRQDSRPAAVRRRPARTTGLVTTSNAAVSGVHHRYQSGTGRRVFAARRARRRYCPLSATNEAGYAVAATPQRHVRRRPRRCGWHGGFDTSANSLDRSSCQTLRDERSDAPFYSAVRCAGRTLGISVPTEPEGVIAPFVLENRASTIFGDTTTW